jgi:hypothetical protein
MLTADLRFEGWTHESWSRFLALWKPSAPPEREAERAHGGLFVLHEAGVIRKLLHTRRGRLSPGEPFPKQGPERTALLPALAEKHDASWVFAAERYALEEVMERFGARLRRSDDLTSQTLTLVAIIQQMTAEGLLDRWPRRLHGVPPPTETVVHRTLDSICPDGKAVMLGLFEDGELHTAAILRRKGKGFDVFAGPAEITPHVGPLSGDWRRDSMYLARTVEETYAPLGFGVFAELDTFRKLQRDAKPGDWGRAVAIRDVSVSPMPPAIALALGVDGARFAAEKIGKLPAVRRFEPLFALVRDTIGDAAGDSDLAQVLGFDPLEALRTLLSR